MSDALESLEEAEPVTPDGDKPSPAKARRYLDERDPEQVAEARSKRWTALIPDGVDGKLRAELEATLDLAHFGMGWPVNRLAQNIVQLSNDLAQKQGLEPDDPVVAREAAVKMVKTIEAAALSQNPFADVPPKLEEYVNKTSSFARSLGWTPQQINLVLKSALVQAEGNKILAAGLFASHVIEEHAERGHRGDVRLDAIESYAERGSDLASSDDGPALSSDEVLHDKRESRSRLEGDDLPESPDDEPYAENRLVTIYTARDDQNEIAAYAMFASDLREEVVEREIRGRAADKMLETLDKVAATSLKPLDYAVYRIMRDEAYRIDANRDVDKPLTKVVQEQLQYDKVQGADLAIKRVKQHLTELGLKDVDELSDQAKKRLTMTTDQAVAEGVANKPKRSKQADLE